MVVVMVEKSVTGVTAEETRLWGEIMVGDLLCDPERERPKEEN